jgi:mRNA interferase YafQ
MRQPVYSGQFKRDVRRVAKRGKDMEKFKELVRLLLIGEPLPPRYRDHPLEGRMGELPRRSHRTRLAPDLQGRWR